MCLKAFSFNFLRNIYLQNFWEILFNQKFCWNFAEFLCNVPENDLTSKWIDSIPKCLILVVSFLIPNECLRKAPTKHKKTPFLKEKRTFRHYYYVKLCFAPSNKWHIFRPSRMTPLHINLANGKWLPSSKNKWRYNVYKCIKPRIDDSNRENRPRPKWNKLPAGELNTERANTGAPHCLKPNHIHA